MQQRRLDDILIDWLAEHRHRIFLTVTLKKSIVDFVNPYAQAHIHLTDEQVIRIGKFLRNNITRRLLGRHRRLNFVTCKEVGLFDQRPHLHVAFDNPNDVPFEDIKGIVESVIKRHPWIYQQWNIQQINSQRSLLAYSLKKGFSAFLPEASWRPTTEDFLQGH